MSGENNSPFNISRSDLQSTISREISNLDKSEVVEGYTRWAVIGAIALIIWEYLNLFPNLNYQTSLQIFFAILFCLILIRLVWKLLFKNSNKDSSATRLFIYGSPARRTEAIVFSLIFVVLAILAYEAVPVDSLKKLAPVVFFLFLSLIGVVFAVIAHFFPVSSSDSDESKSGFGFWIFSVLMIIYCAYSASIFFKELQGFSLGGNISNVKASLLQIALLFLLFRESGYLATRELSNHLQRLELDLSLAKISLDDALNRFETLKLGSSMQSVVRPWIDQVAFCTDDAKANLQECSRILSVAKDEIGGISPNKYEIVDSLLKSAHEAQLKAGDSVRTVKKAIELFLVKLEFFRALFGLGQNEIRFAIVSIKNLKNEVISSLGMVEEDISKLKAELARLKKS